MSVRTTITVLFFLLVLWYIFFVAGTIQYRRLKKKTIAIVMKYAKRAIDGEFEKSYEKVYEALYPEWCEMVRKSALFIPDKSELKPIVAKPENVKELFKFSPQWVKACLIDHEINFDSNQ